MGIFICLILFSLLRYLVGWPVFEQVISLYARHDDEVTTVFFLLFFVAVSPGFLSQWNCSHSYRSLGLPFCSESQWVFLFFWRLNEQAFGIATDSSMNTFNGIFCVLNYVYSIMKMSSNKYEKNNFKIKLRKRWLNIFEFKI